MNTATIKNMASSATDQWNTPRWLVARIAAFMGQIDLDPCPDPALCNIPATVRCMTDGLTTPWKTYMAIRFCSECKRNAQCHCSCHIAAQNVGKTIPQPSSISTQGGIVLVDCPHAVWSASKKMIISASRQKDTPHLLMTKPVQNANKTIPQPESSFPLSHENETVLIPGVEYAVVSKPRTTWQNDETTLQQDQSGLNQSSDLRQVKEGESKDDAHQKQEIISDGSGVWRSPINGQVQIGKIVKQHGEMPVPIAEPQTSSSHKSISSPLVTPLALEQSQPTCSPSVSSVTTHGKIDRSMNGSPISQNLSTSSTILLNCENCHDCQAVYHASRVFMNPPYGREIPKWIAKALAEYHAEHISEMILLVPARVDTRWFKPLFAQPICLITGRLHFNDGPQGAMFPSALVYFGGRPAQFADDFSDIGSIVRGWGRDYIAAIHQERVACGA